MVTDRSVERPLKRSGPRTSIRRVPGGLVRNDEVGRPPIKRRRIAELVAKGVALRMGLLVESRDDQARGAQKGRERRVAGRGRLAKERAEDVAGSVVGDVGREAGSSCCTRRSWCPARVDGREEVYDGRGRLAVCERRPGERSAASRHENLQSLASPKGPHGRDCSRTQSAEWSSLEKKGDGPRFHVSLTPSVSPSFSSVASSLSVASSSNVPLLILVAVLRPCQPRIWTCSRARRKRCQSSWCSGKSQASLGWTSSLSLRSLPQSATPQTS